MTSPFLDATLPELLAMVQNGDLSDPELDALCAAACDGEWVYYGRSWGGDCFWWVYILYRDDIFRAVRLDSHYTKSRRSKRRLTALTAELTRMIEGKHDTSR